MRHIGSGRSEVASAMASAERMAKRSGWRVLERGAGSLTILAPGSWSDYRLTLRVIGDDEAIMLRCGFALAPPDDRKDEISRLASHFTGCFGRGVLELPAGEDFGYFADQLALSDVSPIPAIHGAANGEALCIMMRCAVHTCDKMLFPAFHCVAWSSLNADAAMGFAPLETGERIAYTLH